MYGRNRRSPSPPQRNRGGGGGARHQVLIKNIPFEVDWKKLKDFIKDVAGCDVKFAQIVENKPGRSAGFGFAAFHTSGDMNMAIDRLKRQQLMGREIFIMEDSNQSELERLKEQKGIASSDRRSGGGGAGGNESRDNSRGPCLHDVPIAQINGLNTLDSETLESLGNGEVSNKLFAYNLVYDVNERKLSDVFSMFGEVRDLVVPKKGHAIIEYRQSSDALRALIILRNQFLDGRKMMIKMDGAPFAKNTDNGRPLEKRPRIGCFMRYFIVANINSQMSDHPITGVHNHPARTAMIRITVHIKHHHHQHQRRPSITMAPRRRPHHHQAA